MQITELRIRKVEDEGKLRAYVTVTFDNCFVVHNVKIIEGKSGLFIAMPRRKTATPTNNKMIFFASSIFI